MNDLYTKTVLAIIAAALLALVAQNAVHPSRAQISTDAPLKVEICDHFHCADLAAIIGDDLKLADWGLMVVPPSKP
jgi:hypothetical protein